MFRFHNDPTARIKAIAALPAVCAMMIAFMAGCGGPGKASQKTGDVPAPPPGSMIPVPPKNPTAPITATDPCATALHDTCGLFLQYFVINRRLPDRLQDLSALTDAELALSCPVSRKSYIYLPEGLPRPKQEGRIILYDATPAHSGVRWAILLETKPSGPVMRVIALTEPQLSAAMQAHANEVPPNQPQ